MKLENGYTFASCPDYVTFRQFMLKPHIVCILELTNITTYTKTFTV